MRRMNAEYNNADDFGLFLFGPLMLGTEQFVIHTLWVACSKESGLEKETPG